MRPQHRVAVLACMDSRILFEHCLGLRPGDAHMIRKAGGIATEDPLRSLIVSHYLLATQEFIIINHTDCGHATDCGLLKVREYELRAELTRKMGAIASEPAHFYAFDDLEANVRQQIARVKSHPWIPKDIPVRGFVYDMKTGRLTEVEPRELASPVARRNNAKLGRRFGMRILWKVVVVVLLVWSRLVTCVACFLVAFSIYGWPDMPTSPARPRAASTHSMITPITRI